MDAVIHIPKNELREAIDFCWYHESDTMQYASYSIPFLHQELIISFGDYFSVTGNTQQEFGYDSSGGLSGIFSGPIITRIKGRYRAIGIMFKPFGLYRLFGFSAAQLNEHILPTHALWGNKTKALITLLENIAEPAEKLQALEKFLLAEARPQQIPPEVADAGLPASLERGHIRSLQHQHHISPKKYIQAFHNVIGHTPKKYAQLQLINNAVTQIATTPEIPLTEVAYNNGFYDQAHFIRVFKTFAAMTPMQYKKAVLAKKVHNTFPNTIHLP